MYILQIGFALNANAVKTTFNLALLPLSLTWFQCTGIQFVAHV